MKLSSLAPIALFLAASAALCQENSVPLGDVVRQNKPIKKAARVITNDDLPQRAEPDSAPPSTGATSTASTTAPDASGGANPSGSPANGKTAEAPSVGGKQESGKAAELKAQLADIKSEQSGLENAIKEAEGKLAAEQDPARQEELAAMIKRMNASLENRKSRSAEIKSQLDQLQPAKTNQ